MSSTSKDTAIMSYLDYIQFLITPYEEIKSATNNFADENVLAQGSTFKVYKGQLLQSGDLIDIVARVCSGRSELVSHELTFSHYLKHKHITTTINISMNDDDKTMIINKHEANGSLKEHLSGPSLTWIRRLRICVGVAHALKYLHYDARADGCNVIHGDIKSSKVLLDHNWEPKLHGFKYTFVAKKHLLYRTSKYDGSLQYMDPQYENTRGLTYKSDVFSFGVLLFEVLFGREASIQNNDNWYFARLVRSHYEQRKLQDLINPDLQKQMNLQSLSIFAEIAYCCLKEQLSQRPDMNLVLSKLEEALELQHKQEHPITTAAVEGTSSSSKYLKGKGLDHLRFQLRDIELATNNFSETHQIGSGGYGKVYKAQLNLDEINSSATEGKNKGKLPLKDSIVAIKRIVSTNIEQGEQSFLQEIEMLSNCKHPNIVCLHGFCDEGEEMILVYEYVSKGSLADYLENIDNKTNLTWAQRLQICLDIARGLNYLHTSTKDKQSIVHRDIKSDNILLDDNWVAKIADFGLSKLHHANQQHSTLITDHIAGTPVYLDPEYESTGKLKIKSDIYSFGVVLFEIMCGKVAYDMTYDRRGLPSVVRRCFNEGTLNSLVDPKLMGADENILMLIGGIDQDSLDTFIKVAYQCLAETQSERPTMEVVIKELEKSLNFQKIGKDNLHISLKALNLGTHNFSDSNCIGEGRFWKLYEGKVAQHDVNGCTTIFAKRWDRKSRQGYIQFLTELDTLYRHKHENIIAFAGYCIEMDENIIVYEHAFNGRLDKHLADPSLTWPKRLKICIEVAKGLKFLHNDNVEREDSMMHRDIKSGSILLDGDWNAKICNFEMSCKTKIRERAEHVDANDRSSFGYVDSAYQSDGFLSEKSDVYSLGVVLLEMLCGRLAWAEGCENHSQSLGPFAVRHYEEKRSLDEMIFEGIKKQIMPQSLTIFQETALQCLHYNRQRRPSALDIITRLEKALKFYKIDNDNLRISLTTIKLGTQNFSDCKCIGEGKFWKLYEGEVTDANGCTPILAKRWDRKSGQGNIRFLTELNILSKYKHENIIALVGYCIEMDESIIVYEHASNGSLDKHLGDPGLTWTKRLKIGIDVACGLHFIHFDMYEIHRDIKSGSILLDGDWNAKISNFEMCCSESCHNRAEHVDDNECNSLGYVDPTYQNRGYLVKKSDIYSLGVILIELLFGRLAWAEGCEDLSQSLGPLAKRHYEENGNFNEMIFEGIKKHIASRSSRTFQKIVRKCLQYSGVLYIAGEHIAKRLQKALGFYRHMMDDNLRISLKAIKLGTQNFSDNNCIGEGRFWKLYEGEVSDANGCTPILAKRWDRKFGHAHIQFWNDLDILSKSDRNNVALVGYCNEMDENIIVYKHASNGRLDKHLGDPSLTWIKRLKIGYDVAYGLHCLHFYNMRLHRDIKSTSILLDGDWNAKISNFEFSCTRITEIRMWVDMKADVRVEHVDATDCSSFGYVDPAYQSDGTLTEKSDVYSLAVILLELLCGRLAWAEGCEDYSQSLGPSAVKHYNENGNFDEMIFEGIKKQILPQTLTIYQEILVQCLEYDRRRRPSLENIVEPFRKAVELQEEHETLMSKLPMDYKEIIQASKTPDVYDMFSKGILLQDGKALFSLGSNGERNEMISARKFWFKNRKSHKWRFVQESRFKKVAEVFDISKLKIQIKITTRFLSPGVTYGAYIIFKFCDSRKISRKSMYVNLKYKKGGENLHAYFATWRDDKWMMIELCRFLSDKKENDFEVLLESFSRYHCQNSSIHVEGIEFRVIDNVKHSETEQVQKIMKLDTNKDELLSLNEVNRNKHLMLSAMEVLFDSSNVKCFHLKPSVESRFQEVVELLPQHVFRINCKIQSQMLSQDTEYCCYLVFKLSEKCGGLHCPVIVRDLVRRNKNEASIVYFRNPSPWNLHENHSVPKQREDGLMEVKVWKFNSKHQLKNDCIFVNLKLITYEGTMSGLVVCGMEFRPM